MNLRPSRLEITLEVLSIALLVTYFFLLFRNYNSLPDTIPTHFNGQGEADTFGSKKYFLFIPLVLLILYILLTYINRNPHLLTYPVEITDDNVSRQYKLGRNMVTGMKFITIASFLFLEWRITLGGQYAQNIGVFFPLLIGGVFFVLVVYLSISSIQK